jgi:lipopolysaccharide transport system permease protein
MPIKDQPQLLLYPSQNERIFSNWGSIIRNVKAYRFFIFQLVKISITKAYKKSFIGLSWLFILPILSVIVWILLHGAGIIDPGDTEIPYPAFVLLSTSIWSFFIGAYQSASHVIESNSKIMVMTKFPHEVLVVEKILVHLFNFIIPFAINIVVLLLFGVKFTWISILFPLTLIPLLILGTAIGLIVALLRVVAIDISRLIDQIMGLLMYLTPIIYSPKIELSWLSKIIDFNPLAYLIGFSRDILIKGTFFEPIQYFIFTILSLIFIIISIRIFLLAEAKLLERTINN